MLCMFGPAPTLASLSLERNRQLPEHTKDLLPQLGPQLVGHQGLDFALKWLPARTVSAVTLLEPVGASALAALFLGELPGPNAMLGGLFALVGVFATM